MSTNWISTVGRPNSKLAIIIGEIPDSEIIKESKSHLGGVLWLCENIERSNDLMPPSVQCLSPHESQPALSRRITDFIALDYQDIPCVKVSPSVAGCKTYSDALDLLISKIEVISRARRTRQATGFDRQYLVFQNMPGYLLSRVPTDWSSLGKKCFALVVGAGPSLDVTLPIFQAGFPRPIIIACDSALSALSKLGIAPDFLISIDPHKSFESCSRQDLSPGIAILSSQSHPSWSRQWGDKVRYLSGRVLTEDWLATKGVSKTNILAANNAGLTALSFAHSLSPSLIITIGMDLSSGLHHGDRYAGNTGRTHIQVHAEHYHTIPGNFEKTVKTPFFADWEETSKLSLDISRQCPIFNLTDRGAVLEGATLVHPDDSAHLKQAVSESILPFTPDARKLSLKKQISGIGLEHLLATLLSCCDQVWLSADKYNLGSQAKGMLYELFKDSDLSSLLGDFSFVTMPWLQKESVDEQKLESAVSVLRKITCALEDAVLKCCPSKRFAINQILSTGQ